MNHDAKARALGRITVLDLTRVRAGPTCVRQFGDWGANVIKVEAPVTDPKDSSQADFSARHEADFQNLHRNKRSITLNMKSSEGKQIFTDLVSEALLGSKLRIQR